MTVSPTAILRGHDPEWAVHRSLDRPAGGRWRARKAVRGRAALLLREQGPHRDTGETRLYPPPPCRHSLPVSARGRLHGHTQTLLPSLPPPPRPRQVTVATDLDPFSTDGQRWIRAVRRALPQQAGESGHRDPIVGELHFSGLCAHQPLATIFPPAAAAPPAAPAVGALRDECARCAAGRPSRWTAQPRHSRPCRPSRPARC